MADQPQANFTESDIAAKVKEDKINHPQHYNRNWQGEQTIEPYDFISSWRMEYDEGNVIKYVSRHKYKGKPLEDLKKARWYLDKIIDRLEKK